MTSRAVWLSLLVACTTNPPAPFQPAFDGDAPQLRDLGGGVLALPKVQPVVFAGDDAMRTTIDDFAGKLATSDYWAATTSEYGVGPLTALPSIAVADAPPTTDDALQTMLAADFPSFDASTIYTVFLPAGVTLTSGDATSCVDFGAYHYETEAGLVYALIPRCDTSTDAIDRLTASTSHELIEAATDPHFVSNPGFGDVDLDHRVWSLTPGAEVGDFCENVDTADKQLVGYYWVQRTWSNAAAKAGHDPCVPAPSTPYIAAEPILTDSLELMSFAGASLTKGIAIPVGESRTIDVQLYSDAEADAFTVEADDVSSYMFGGPAELSFSWDRTTGVNGDVRKLTIKRERAGSMPGSELVIAAIDDDGSRRSLWWAYAD